MKGVTAKVSKGAGSDMNAASGGQGKSERGSLEGQNLFRVNLTTPKVFSWSGQKKTNAVWGGLSWQLLRPIGRGKKLWTNKHSKKHLGTQKKEESKNISLNNNVMGRRLRLRPHGGEE